MTDLTEESKCANRDHHVIQVRAGGERLEIEISDVGNQTLSGNETNKDELLASLIEKKLPQEFPKPDPPCIFRVPTKIRGDNENAFVPQVVPIGPYHHEGEKFEAVEQIKLRNLQCLLKLKPTPDTSLVKFVKEIRSKEVSLRNCYNEKLGDHLSSDQFVEMMVVDGCFILELMRNPISICRDVFGMPEMLSIIKNDLFLLENQLPWEVLDCLFNLTTSSSSYESSLHNHTGWFISDVTSCWIMNDYQTVEILMDYNRETWQFRHLLDIIRDMLVGSFSWNEDGSYRSWDGPYKDWTHIPSVTHLEEIGVKFQLAAFETEPLRITFNENNGVMEIPYMKIGRNTERVLRNLAAYERCSMKPHYFFSYAMLLNQLIKSTKDLDSLLRKRIVETNLSKEDTVSLFNRLCNDTISIPFAYSGLAIKVGVYNDDRWLRRWLARIKRDHLYNPSSIWSVSNAVIIILILTAMQTLYGVLAYYN